MSARWYGKVPSRNKNDVAYDYDAPKVSPSLRIEQTATLENYEGLASI